MSSYKGIDLFGSGPHRFWVGRRGHQLVTYLSQGVPAAGTFSVGLVELVVMVRGRLVAGSDADLWAQRDVIVGQMTFPPSPGVLIDSTGRSFPSMTLTRYTEGQGVDRGRLWTLSYVVEFRRIAPPP
jgi:hypothetical protein